VLVINRTRVRAARLVGAKRDTGGSVEVLLLRRLDDDRWEALIKPARRIKPGIVIDYGPIEARVLTAPVRGQVVVALKTATGDVEDALPTIGEIPLPPYIHIPLSDPGRYQTMFAKTVGSAAAPTAALHFTPRLVERLGAAGIDFAEVDLEVGLDTFRPIAVDRLAEHTMHQEQWHVPTATEDAIATTRRKGGRVVAVGTTVVRTLESAACGDGLVTAGSGATDLFIQPGYRLQVADVVVTNFHAPRTTLIVMIAALLGERWRAVYAHALATGYRFLSFGDAMLIDKPVNHR
jgi:S-adenosylmethionine:tRNA ribosyltransferase-isomerase